jgi:hypothetical protein
MSDSNSNSSQNPALTPEQVSAVFNDKELRSLRPGSNEYQAAFAKKFGQDGKTTSASATEGSNDKDTSGTNEVSDQKSDASNNDKDDEFIGKRGQRRFDKLHAENKKLSERLAQLENAGKSTGTEPKAQPTAQEQTTFNKPKPKPEDFKFVVDYTDALTDWKLEKAEFVREEKTQRAKAQESYTSTFNNFLKAGKAIEKEMGFESGDFDAVVLNEDFKMDNAAKEALLESEFGAQIAFEIGVNDEQRDKFVKMNPAQQVKYIGKLEAKYEGKKQAKEETKTISAAKSPGKSLQKPSSLAGASRVKSEDTAKGYRAFEAARNEQRKALGKR